MEKQFVGLTEKCVKICCKCRKTWYNKSRGRTISETNRRRKSKRKTSLY
ncbi:hypothetical protein [Hominilimicola sp.]|nr:MAG TPA: hypothetical protein [Caudoviricetes sp.]DAY19538.1 MAG TPA: hypothetical protein [Caudoviricetes sp.]